LRLSEYLSPEDRTPLKHQQPGHNGHRDNFVSVQLAGHALQAKVPGEDTSHKTQRD